jgi:hypothetical protein
MKCSRPTVIHSIFGINCHACWCMGKGKDTQGIKPHRQKVHISIWRRRKEDDDEVNLGNCSNKAYRYVISHNHIIAVNVLRI